MAYLFNFVGKIVSNLATVHAYHGNTHIQWEMIKSGEYVNKLTADNVDSFLRSNRSVLLFFYSSTCSHCQELMPEYAKAAEMLSRYDPTFKLAAMDAVRFKSVQARYRLTEVPTVNLYRHGKFVTEYTLRRIASDIIIFARRNGANPNNQTS